MFKQIRHSKENQNFLIPFSKENQNFLMQNLNNKSNKKKFKNIFKLEFVRKCIV